MQLRLTVIDQTPVHGDRPPSAAAQSSVELAMACEKLGYFRYWLAEHHNSIQFAGPAPEILLTRIASSTKTMRIGSGGVMLSHYSPYKIAEVFALLANLFPGRIDLGIGRAPGGDHLSSAALAAPGQLTQRDSFGQQAAEMCAFLRRTFKASHPYAQLECSMDEDALPSLWMLGSSGGSAGLAGQLGMGLALARFIAPGACSPTIFDNHTASLSQAGYTEVPRRLLALAVICAESNEQARFIAGTAVYRKMMTAGGAREPLLCPHEVELRRQQMSALEKESFEKTLNDMVVGSPEHCKQEILRLADNFGCAEIGIVTVTHSYLARRKSYELLAGILAEA
ncbi:MsnO8 family LLM class oxidoreductase [Pseudomonas kitaguniensis]|uniref:MsnO8 family LLM class oxidoreductase n=1 Tax=Pseudomonas kitaguniensis TaxID=2607908 RepID=UPI003D061D0D